MIIKHKKYKGNPGLVVNTPNAIIKDCVFLCFDRSG